MAKIKAEMWDKMQFLFRNYYDRMVHAALYYDGSIDVSILKQVILFTLEKVPILHSRFVNNPVEPYWETADYVLGDVLTVVESSNLEADVNAFLTQCIPVESNVQCKIAVINYEGKSTLCMIVNHMCFDGGDLKYFLKKLAENYTKLKNGDKSLSIKTGDRSYTAVYSKLSGEDLATAKGLYKNISAVKDKHEFPLTPPADSDYVRIMRRVIPSETFSEFRKLGKKLEVTVNDLMLAVYIKALYEVGNFPVGETFTIPCMVDLRRHIQGGGEEGGLTNHTGFMVCSVDGKGEDINDMLIKVLRSTKKSKKDKFMGLYSLPLLKLAYTVFPQIISEQAIKIGYLNPLIGMSNIGVLDDVRLRMDGLCLIDGFLTGAVKYKPYMQLALTSLYDALTMTIALRASDEDEETVCRFFDLIENNIADFIKLNKEVG